MKTLQITADWILNNFSHEGWYPGDGFGSIFCDFSDVKWIVLALENINFEFSEVTENEIGIYEAEFHFLLSDISSIAPDFYKEAMEINDANISRKN
jgi:hypothetical protein